MRKVAVFVEGHCDLIFIRQILFYLVGAQNLSFETLDLFEENLRPAFYAYNHTPENPSIHYRIINVKNDEKVIGAIVDSYNGLISAGYEIVGVRDIYSEAYKKRSRMVDMEVINHFIQQYSNTLQLGSVQVRFFCAIMELEAWVLAMYKVFARIDSRLTTEYIAEHLGYDLRVVDPEVQFFHPAEDLARVFRLVGKDYDKHRSEMENIVSHIVDEDILEVLEDARYKSFTALLLEFQRQYTEAKLA